MPNAAVARVRQLQRHQRDRVRGRARASPTSSGGATTTTPRRCSPGRSCRPTARAVTTSAGIKLTADGPPPRGPAGHRLHPGLPLHDGGAPARARRAPSPRPCDRGCCASSAAAPGWPPAAAADSCSVAVDFSTARSRPPAGGSPSLFAREFPRVELRGDELVTAGERLLCAGPVNAHFNLALRVVESFAGRDLALHCAKVLLVDANRPSQRPYVLLQDQLRHTDDLIVRGQEWMRRHLLEEDFSIETLARALGRQPAQPGAPLEARERVHARSPTCRICAIDAREEPARDHRPRPGRDRRSGGLQRRRLLPPPVPPEDHPVAARVSPALRRRPQRAPGDGAAAARDGRGEDLHFAAVTRAGGNGCGTRFFTAGIDCRYAKIDSRSSSVKLESVATQRYCRWAASTSSASACSGGLGGTVDFFGTRSERTSVQSQMEFDESCGVAPRE